MKTLAERLALTIRDVERMSRRHVGDHSSELHSEILSLYRKVLAAQRKLEGSAATLRKGNEPSS